MKKEWCIPSVGPDFVWRMEDVLDLYAEPFDPKCPQVCFDERPCQLLGDVLAPMGAKPGRVKRVDHEYERKGKANLFVMVQPLAGWRHLEVTERRTSLDFAQQMKDLVDKHFPLAEVIRVVLDNLSTHSPCLPVPSLPSRGGSSPYSQIGVPLHAKTWQLAQHGRDRTLTAVLTVPQAANTRLGQPSTPGRGLADPAKCQSSDHQLAFLHDRC